MPEIYKIVIRNIHAIDRSRSRIKNVLEKVQVAEPP